tara:strand:+ start:561 stop:815 length:255 start_codon:yes stop_codon:yes gene_type:complete
MKTTKQKCQDLYDKIYDAFENQSGGEYNDTMYVQWLGASQDMFEADEDGDWDYALNNLKECWNYVKVCKKIDYLQTNMPDAIYC